MMRQLGIADLRRLLIAGWLAIYVSLALIRPVSGQPTPKCSAEAESLLRKAAEATAEDDPSPITLYREAIARDPHCLAAYLELAEFLAVFDRYTEAIEVLQAARAFAPENFDVLQDLLSYLFDAGRYEEMIQLGLANQTLIGGYDLAFLGYLMGSAYAKLGNLDEAIRWLEAAKPGVLAGTSESALIEVYKMALSRSFDREIAYKLGRLLYERFEFAEASSVFSDIISHVPEWAPPYFWLGLAEIRLARASDITEERRTHYNTARKALLGYLQLAPAGEFASQARQLLTEIP